jgi:ATP-dependent Clp protease adaptor protein ClpS
MVDTDILIDVEKVTKTTMRAPSKFNVVFYNDNVTTMEFVILVLMSIFHKSFDEARNLCLSIHENGKGIAGTFSHEVASQKRDETINAARANGFPLQCEIEEVQNS